MTVVPLPLWMILVAQTDSGIPDYVPQGLGLGVVLSVLYLLWRIQRRDRRDLEGSMLELRAHHQRCEWRLNLVIEANRRAGVPVPSEVWGPAPWERDDHGGPP